MMCVCGAAPAPRLQETAYWQCSGPQKMESDTRSECDNVSVLLLLATASGRTVLFFLCVCVCVCTIRQECFLLIFFLEALRQSCAIVFFVFFCALGVFLDLYELDIVFIVSFALRVAHKVTFIERC